jgi:hypothetical protein
MWHNLTLTYLSYNISSLKLTLTPNSWLFLITRIYTSKYNVKITTKRFIVHFHDISNTTNDSHNKSNVEIHEEVCTS